MRPLTSSETRATSSAQSTTSLRQKVSPACQTDALPESEWPNRNLTDYAPTEHPDEFLARQLRQELQDNAKTSAHFQGSDSEESVRETANQDSQSSDPSNATPSTTRNYTHRYLKKITAASEAWQEVQVPYKEVTVSLADSQIRQEAGSGPAKTVVSHALWKKYVQRARALKEDVSDYDHYVKTFGKKRPKLKVMLSDGHPVDCYGPFKCRLNIGPTPVRMTVWVTADPHFGVDFVLGRYDWPVMALKTMHQPPADRPPHNEAHIQCQGPDNREVRHTSGHRCRTQRVVIRCLQENGLSR